MVSILESALFSWWKIVILGIVFCERGHGCQYAKVKNWRTKQYLFKHLGTADNSGPERKESNSITLPKQESIHPTTPANV